MKQKIKYSLLALCITYGCLLLFIIGIISMLDDPDKLYFFSAIMGITTLFGLYYCPTAVSVSPEGITLHRLLSRARHFSAGDIQSVDFCYPSGGGIRICGSGGFCGFWGYFNDIIIGTYFGYFGSRNHCILMRLKSGRQYVLGCENPDELINYIHSLGIG